MLGKIIDKYKNSKEFLNYFFLTYLDKIISFALPLSVLFIIKDKALYAFVEVAFSYATLGMIVVELGLSNYLFYGYKKADDKENFLANVQVFFKFVLLFYGVLSLLLILYVRFYDPSLMLIYTMVGIRTLFMLYLNFNSNIYRLKDSPSRIYMISILVNVTSFILLMLAHGLSWTPTIVFFFIPSLLLLIFTVIRFVFLELTLFRFGEFKVFLKESLKFSWPIILNVLAMTYMNNYAKIYAYGNLSQAETVQISYIMRIGLIIQLTHSAFSSFYSKTLFMDEDHTFNRSIFKRYNLILLLSLFFVFAIIFVTNWLFGEEIYIPLSLSTFFFLVYIVLWCYIGYLEIYFGILNANRRILYYSVFSSLIYTLLLKLSDSVSVFQLSLYMLVTVILNLVLIVFGLYKLKVLTLKR